GPFRLLLLVHGLLQLPRQNSLDGHGLRGGYRRLTRCWLEAELHAQLNLARTGGEIGPKRFQSRLPKDGRVGQKIMGLIELHAIKEIGKLEVEVEHDAVW